jgi:hypothetical protein
MSCDAASRDKLLQPGAAPCYLDSMRRPISFKQPLGVSGAVVLAVGLGAGCGEAPTHPLTLVSYKDIGCNPMVDPECLQFYGCTDLNIKELNIEVGIFHRESTTLPCPAELASGQSQANVQVMVPYRPGQDFYMVDANFIREGSTVYLTAGPFTEDEAQTPWRLILR